MQLTVRTYKPEVRKRVLASIERVAKGEAMAGGAPKEPLVKITPAANATYNDPELTKRLVAALRGVLGQANVVELAPVMGFEDFAEFNLAAIPSADFWVGAVEPGRFASAQQSATPCQGCIRPYGLPATSPPSKRPSLSKRQNCWNYWGMKHFNSHSTLNQQL